MTSKLFFTLFPASFEWGIAGTWRVHRPKKHFAMEKEKWIWQSVELITFSRVARRLRAFLYCSWVGGCSELTPGLLLFSFEFGVESWSICNYATWTRSTTIQGWNCGTNGKWPRNRAFNWLFSCHSGTHKFTNRTDANIAANHRRFHGHLDRI